MPTPTPAWKRFPRRVIIAVAAMASFAFAAPAMATYAVGDRVFGDTNNNGVFDTSSESGISNVLVRLYADTNANCIPDGGPLLSSRTNASGAYLFAGVGSTRYLIELDASNFTGTGALVGYASSTGSSSQTSGPYEPGLNESNNAADNNKDHGSNASGTIRACQIVIVGGTEPTGEGNQPPGITNPDSDPNTNNTIDFGVYKPAQVGALGDRVWDDRNHNGIQEAGEAGVGGVTVRLLNTAGTTVLATTTTNASGNYLFPNLAPGTYTVEFVKPAGSEFTLEDIGADQTADSDPSVTTGRTSEGVVTAGQTNTQIDAGIWYPLNLGNLVWRDANNNGRVDAGEPGVSGVTVELLSGTIVVATTTTNASGNYNFPNLLPGNYSVRIPAGNFGAGAPLAGLTTSTGGGSEPAPDPDNNANDDDNGTAAAGAVTSAPVTLSPGTEPTDDGDGNNGNLSVDFGFRPPLGSIGDRVWLDQNGNGVQDAGEPGQGGVTVSLCTSAGTVITTTTTAADGSYSFPNLAPGSYQVGFTNLPAGTALSPANQGGNDATDSDAPSVGACTIPVTLAAGENNTTIDAGVYQPLALGNQVWRDTNNNGVVDAGEPGISGVTVELLQGTAVVATTTTNSSGNYQFTGLRPGDYSVRIPAANFAAGAPLASLSTSTGGGSEPAPDPDNNTDNNDNGSAAGGAVTSLPVTLASGTEPTDDGDGNNANQTVDFGFIPPPATASVGDRVWLDQNANGVQDAGEPGQGGVTVSLCNAAGTVVSTTTSAADGSYAFTGLAAGSYQVGFTNLPAGTALSPANQGGNDATDSDAPSVGTCTIPVTLTAGENNTTIDAGVYQPLNLGNLVWRDANNNGRVDAGEPGISGVTVELLQGTTVVATTTTNAGGNYQFTGLRAGDYTVRIPAANFAGGAPLAGLSSSTGGGSEPAPDPDNNADNDDNGSAAGGAVTSLPVTLASGTEPTDDGDGNNANQTVDFGFIPPAPQNASVGDRVWEDTNHNGIQDAGEPGLGGVTVTLCNPAGTVVSTTTSAADGSYAFTGLAPGSYQVGFTNLPAGGALTLPNEGGNDATDSDAATVGTCTIPVTLAAGENNTTVDAGAWFPLNLGNLVFRDTNNNGVADAGEAGVGGVTVELLSGTTVVATTTTNGTGNYNFPDLTPGDYSVRIPASNFAAGAPLAGLSSSTGGGSEPASDPDNNVDNDDNGTTAAGAVTSAPVTLARGTEPTTDGDGNNGNLTVDFGFISTPTGVASIGDKVWLDSNNNGVQDPGEPGVTGVTVTLCNPAGQVVQTRTTGVDGSYSFTDLAPGSYQVGFTTIPAGSQLTTPNAGGNDATDSDATALGTCTIPVTVAAGENNTTIDAGIWTPLVLGNTVFDDQNNNGTKEAAEPGIAGVTVQLVNGAGAVVATTTTNASGNYQFTGLAPGDYKVVLPATNFAAGAPLAGYVSSTGTNGSATGPAEPGPATNNDTDNDDNGTGSAGMVMAVPVTLTSGGEPTTDGDGANGNQTVDFGVFKPASLGDTVWNDVNQNGIQDPSEAGVPGVTVTLYNAAGTAIATATTDAQGKYSFTNLTPGDYSIGVSNLPLGATVTMADQGADNAADSDINPTTGRSAPVTLAAGDNNPTLDAGIVIPAGLGDKVFSDTNGNGIQDAGEPGVPGVTVTLYDGKGVQIAQQTTDASGNYFFPNLPAGVYTVGFTNLPAGTSLSPANVGANDAADSDADPTTGRTTPINLVGGDRNITIDAGITPPGVIVIGGERTALSIRKGASKAITNRRTNVLFTITVRNIGTATARNVRICDRIPSGFSFVRARGAQVRGGQACWNVGNLNAGQSRTVRITLRANTAGNRTNIATARADNANRVTGRARVRILAVIGSPSIPKVTGSRP